jgi:hypothetical protein
MIRFTKRGPKLIMSYTPERASQDWLVEPLERDKEEIPISGRAFYVRGEIRLLDVRDDEDGMDGGYRFLAGRLDGEYFRMDRRFLGIEYDLFLHKSLTFQRTTFVAETNIPIFRGFNSYGLAELHIGGKHPDAVPREVFEDMLRQFPNSYELKKYARARVSSMIRNYVPIGTDFQAQYQKYRERKASKKGSQPGLDFGEYESDKFSALVTKIEAMLDASGPYSESQWQEEVLQVVRFLYPKYIVAFKEAPVYDSLAKKNRKIDFLLVDASGYVDAIEIKKPFVDCLVTPNRYRDNHVPMRELSGTVMQLEKYLYHLNRWGQVGEESLNKRYANQVPGGLRIKIVNPSGMIIIGRDEAFTVEQRTDFEVIRRKYRNVLDIMTYDDLLRRLKAIRDQLKGEPR